MEADHTYLGELLQIFLAEDKCIEEISQKFQNFQNHLFVHIELENNFLFPCFDKFTGIKPENGPTAIAMRDHKNIVELLKIIKENCASKDIEKVRKIGARLNNIMQKHGIREKKIQYPVSDFFVDQDEWHEVLKKTYGQELEKVERFINST